MLNKLSLSTVFVLTSATFAVADGHKTPFPEGASVYFANLKDGATVSSPVTVQFGLKGMGVAPAGITEKDNVGHHHVLLNRPALGQGEDGAEEWEYGLPADDNHIHFGGGQTEVTLDLPPGKHTLQMVLGDHSHVPFGPELATEVVTIIVE